MINIACRLSLVTGAKVIKTIHMANQLIITIRTRFKLQVRMVESQILNKFYGNTGRTD